MAEYIEREAAYADFEKCNSKNPKWNPIRVKTLIARQKAADVAPVRYGRWRYYSTTMQECSNCQRHTARHKFKYCPHCGAIMEDKYHESTD